MRHTCGAAIRIGDPDQAVYGFRGADSQYFRILTQEFPQTRLLQLATNYRSTQTIVRASGTVIAHNSDRQPLHLQAAGDVGTPLWLYFMFESAARGKGERLGPAGGRITAEVLTGLIDADPESYRALEPDWTPSLPARGDRFGLTDLLAPAN